MCDGFEECALAIHKNCNISAMFVTEFRKRIMLNLKQKRIINSTAFREHLFESHMFIMVTR